MGTRGGGVFGLKDRDFMVFTECSLADEYAMAERARNAGAPSMLKSGFQLEVSQETEVGVGK